jgi:hypothetical protein
MFILGILVLNGIIILDSFLLAPVQRDEIYKMRSSVTSWGGYRLYRTYSTDYLVTQSGHRYQLPDHCWIHRTENDSVTIGLTRLLRRPATVSWCEEGGCYKVDIGIISGSYFSLVPLSITTLLALIVACFPSFRSQQWRETYLCAAICIAALFFAFYFC